MEYGYYLPGPCVTLSLLLCLFCFLDNSHGQIICPTACQCLGLSVDCRGDSQTLAHAIQDLPISVESFRFTVWKQSKYQTADVDLNTIPGLGKFRNLCSFQIQSYSLSAPYHYISTLPRNIFCNWTQLEEIHLNIHSAYNNSSMDPLFCLQRLKVLDLSYSRLIPDSALQYLLSTNLSRQITTLLLRNIQTVGVEGTTEINFARLFSQLNRSSLEVIDLSANAIRSCYPGLLFIPNLKKLDLSENMLFSWSSLSKALELTRLTFIEAALHPTLEEISLSDMETFMPRNTDHGTAFFDEFNKLLTNCSQILEPSSQFGGEDLLPLCSILRNLTGSIQNSSQCVLGLQIPFGKHLQLINISSSTRYSYPYINPVPRGRYCLNPDNNLTVLDFSNMHAAQFSDDPTLSNVTFTGLNRIKTLNLVNNDFMLNNFKLFDTMPSLEQLLLGGNEVQIHLDGKNELFKSLVNLRNLDLSQNKLHTVPFAEFSHLSKLQRLDLSGNKLQGLNIQLPATSPLQMLNLSSNEMTFLQATMADQFDRYPLLEIDLQGNSFICNCEALWFVRWVQTTPTRLIGRHFLDCYTEEGLRTITQINLKEFSKRCHPMSQLEVGLISASAGIGFMLLLFGLSVVYRQRWRIRHYWYRRRFRRERIALNDDYEYDAYVSYSDSSPDVVRWVGRVMHEELECRRGLKLFIYQRDLLGGGLLLERIDDAMRKCRKTILVLSPEFLQSRTCLYSMVAEDRDAVVLVKLQHLPLTGITDNLASIMEIRECLNWTNDPDRQNLFWEQLEDALSSVDNPMID